MNHSLSKNNIVNQYRRKVILLFAIPILALCIFFNPLIIKPYYQLQLITSNNIVSGYLSNVKQQYEKVENDDGKTNEGRAYFTYEYNFKLPDGRTIKSSGQENGLLSQYLSTLNKNSNQIEVEYVSEHPEYNRIKGMESAETIYEWLRYTVLINVTIVLFCLYLIYSMFKSIRKE